MNGRFPSCTIQSIPPFPQITPHPPSCPPLHPSRRSRKLSPLCTTPKSSMKLLILIPKIPKRTQKWRSLKDQELGSVLPSGNIQSVEFSNRNSSSVLKTAAEANTLLGQHYTSIYATSTSRNENEGSFY